LEFNFKIVYHPGTAGRKPDIPTHRSGDLPKEEDNYSLENQRTIIKLENIIDTLAAAYHPTQKEQSYLIYLVHQCCVDSLYILILLILAPVISS
jgi:hypothetical protein